jgi:hypothetical protein
VNGDGSEGCRAGGDKPEFASEVSTPTMEPSKRVRNASGSFPDLKELFFIFSLLTFASVKMNAQKPRRCFYLSAQRLYIRLRQFQPRSNGCVKYLTFVRPSIARRRCLVALNLSQVKLTRNGPRPSAKFARQQAVILFGAF